MHFQIHALDPQPFAPLFELSDEELRARMAVRRTATAKPGFPCRVSLVDAEVGEELLLVNYVHQDGASPYRASHAIFVRKGARQARLAIDEVPQLLRFRILSLRAFSSEAAMVDAELCAGKKAERVLAAQLCLAQVAYVHIHYAKYGCYAARADRV